MRRPLFQLGFFLCKCSAHPAGVQHFIALAGQVRIDLEEGIFLGGDPDQDAFGKVLGRKPTCSPMRFSVYPVQQAGLPGDLQLGQGKPDIEGIHPVVAEDNQTLFSLLP